MKEKIMSWSEVIELWQELKKAGLTLLIRDFVKDEFDHTFMILTAPQVELAVDIDTPLSIPHRGGLTGVMGGDP